MLAVYKTMKHSIQRGSLVLLALAWLCQVRANCAEPGLVGHWKLQGDCRDSSGHGNDGVNHGVDLDRGGFDGAQAYIEIPSSDSLKLGKGILRFVLGFTRRRNSTTSSAT